MKDLDYTHHAIDKMVSRLIQKTWVERAIRSPLWTEPEPRYPDAKRYFAEIEEFGGRILRVVCVETENSVRVITATFDRGARKRR